MSAELLRRAATILRERAEAATPGLWSTNALDHVVDMGVGQRGFGSPYAGCFYGDAAPKSENAAYIATMHPGVGLTLADWLDTAGADLWAHGPLCECGSGCFDCDDSLWQPHVRRALTVALLIVGESND